jgi:hypothetical protein
MEYPLIFGSYAVRVLLTIFWLLSVVLPANAQLVEESGSPSCQQERQQAYFDGTIQKPTRCLGTIKKRFNSVHGYPRDCVEKNLAWMENEYILERTKIEKQYPNSLKPVTESGDPFLNAISNFYSKDLGMMQWGWTDNDRFRRQEDQLVEIFRINAGEWAQLDCSHCGPQATVYCPR